MLCGQLRVMSARALDEDPFLVDSAHDSVDFRVRAHDANLPGRSPGLVRR